MSNGNSLYYPGVREVSWTIRALINTITLLFSAQLMIFNGNILWLTLMSGKELSFRDVDLTISNSRYINSMVYSWYILYIYILPRYCVNIFVFKCDINMIYTTVAKCQYCQ